MCKSGSVGHNRNRSQEIGVLEVTPSVLGEISVGRHRICRSQQAKVRQLFLYDPHKQRHEAFSLALCPTSELAFQGLKIGSVKVLNAAALQGVFPFTLQFVPFMNRANQTRETESLAAYVRIVIKFVDVSAQESNHRRVGHIYVGSITRVSL
jgi:hypothetical protein